MIIIDSVYNTRSNLVLLNPTNIIGFDESLPFVPYKHNTLLIGRFLWEALMVRMKPLKQQEVLMVYFLGEVHLGRLQSSHWFVYIVLLIALA